MRHPKISIVIPVYNTSAFLRQCLDSCVNQTLSDIEIICVDDCSTDRSPEILREYATMDSRIRIVRHKENRGLLHARITGTLEATGSYVQHLDSDDWIDHRTCEKVYKALKKTGAELCHFGVFLEYDDGRTETGYDDVYWSVYSGEKSADVFLKRVLNDTVAHCVFTIVAKREIAIAVYTDIQEDIKKRLFLAEDLLYTVLVARAAKTCVFLPYRLHHYRVGVGGSFQSNISGEKFVQLFNDVRRVFVFLEALFHDVDTKWRRLFAKKKYRHYIDFSAHRWLQLSDSEKRIAYAISEDHGILKDLLEVLFEKRLYDDILSIPEDIFSTEDCEGSDGEFAADKSIALFINRMCNGGRERVVQLLANGLAARGWKVVVIAAEPPTRDDFPLHNSVKRITIQRDEKGFLERVINVLRRHKINIVGVHDYLDSRLLLLATYMRLHDIRVCFSDHAALRGELFVMRDSRIVQRLLCARHIFNAITCLSWYDVLFLRQFSENIVFMANPSDLLGGAQNYDDRKASKIIWVGRLERVLKRPDHAIRAFAHVHELYPRATLTIIGSETDGKQGGYYRSLKKLARQLKCASHVHFVGYSNDVQKYFQNSDIHWLTSASEGFPMVWLEAKASGVPTVMYDMPWVALNGEGSVCVPQGDYAALADQTVALLKNKKMLRKQSADAHDDFLERFQPDKLLDRWSNFYQSILLGECSEYCGERPPRDVLQKRKHILAEYITAIITSKTQQCNAESFSDNYHALYMDVINSKSFRLGNLFFRSIRSPYKLLAYPINFLRILFEKK